MKKYAAVLLLIASMTLTQARASEQNGGKEAGIGAETDPAPYSDPTDPWEAMNRSIFAFNDALDRIVLEPAARGYRAAVPDYGRDRIGSALSNLSEPVSFLNALLQGDVNQTFVTFWRFVINSTVGIGGLYDVAAETGLKEREEDFGQTLAVHGAGSGPYLMLPVLGPSNLRDTAGLVVDAFTNPFNYFEEEWTVAGLKAADMVDTREGLLETVDDIRRTSFDPYATVRSAYTQHRNDRIANGQ